MHIYRINKVKHGSDYAYREISQGFIFKSHQLHYLSNQKGPTFEKKKRVKPT